MVCTEDVFFSIAIRVSRREPFVRPWNDNHRFDADSRGWRNGVSFGCRQDRNEILQLGIFLSSDPCRTAQVLENKRGKHAEKLRRQDVLIEKLREVHRLQDGQELKALRQEIEEVT